MCELFAGAPVVTGDATRPHSRPLEFFLNLSSMAMSDFESLALRMSLSFRIVTRWKPMPAQVESRMIKTFRDEYHHRSKAKAISSKRGTHS